MERYVVGTEAEGMSISADGIGYRPAGAAHVVDTDSASYVRGCALAYALCGRPVLVWADRPLDTARSEIDKECAARMS